LSWIDKAENAMQNLSHTLSVPYDYERNESPEDQLPDTYMVYFLVDDPPKTHYDGKETSRTVRVQVGLFFRDKRMMITAPPEIEKAFKAEGFMRIGSGIIPYQKDTRHYGWRCDFRYYERND